MMEERKISLKILTKKEDKEEFYECLNLSNMIRFYT